MGKGIEAGEGKGSHQPRYPQRDTEQGCKLNVPAADSAVRSKGDGKQEQEAGQCPRSAMQQSFREGCLRVGSIHQRQEKEAPGKEGKQGSVAYPVVPFIVQCKPGKKQQGKCVVCKQQLIHVWNTNHQTGCPESARHHLH